MPALVCACLVALAAPAPTEGPPRGAKPNAADRLQERRAHFGIGGVAGDPMGLSMKLFIRPRHALQWHLGWGPIHRNSLRLSMDYVFMPKPWVSNQLMDFMGYAGVGIGVAATEITGDVGFGLLGRVPVLGFAFHWRTVPIDTVLDLAWSPFFVPLSLPHADAAIAIRYYF